MVQNWASEAHIPYTTESTCNEHVKQYECEISENFLRKWSDSRLLTYFGVHNGPKIGPLRPILYTPLKIAPMSIKTRLMWIQRKRHPEEKSSKTLIFTHPLHTYKTSSNKFINQVWCESSGYFKKQWTKTYILTYFGPISEQYLLKNLAHRGQFSHTFGSTHDVPVN